MAHTLLLEVPEDIYKRLERTAEQTGQPLEELAIELLARAEDCEDDPLEKHIGAFSSDIRGGFERHDELIGATLMRGMRTGTQDKSEE